MSARIFVTTIYDSKTLIENEDYDTLFLTTLAASIAVCMTVMTLILPVSIVGTIIIIALTYIATFIKESSLDMYFIRSLFYKIVDFSLIKVVLQKAQKKQYQAKYLFETTNKNEKLKAISNDGFNKDVKLIEFIGKNYKGNEKYFDTALQNELSFFKAALLGYKLELLGRRKGKKLKNYYGYDVELIQDTFVRIPSVLYSAKDSKFILVFDNKYILLEKNRENFTEENGNIVFDLQNQKFTTLIELNTINHKKASIIILSSEVELKYDFVYEYKEIVYLDALNFEQKSFTPQDSINLQQFIKKEEK